MPYFHRHDETTALKEQVAQLLEARHRQQEELEALSQYFLDTQEENLKNQEHMQQVYAEHAQTMDECR